MIYVKRLIRRQHIVCFGKFGHRLKLRSALPEGSTCSVLASLQRLQQIWDEISSTRNPARWAVLISTGKIESFDDQCGLNVLAV